MNLALHGTKEAPSHYSNGYRPYDAFKLVKSVSIEVHTYKYLNVINVATVLYFVVKIVSV